MDISTLKLIRQVHGLRQKDLAKMMNVSESAIAKWETQREKPSFENQIKLAQIYGMSVEALFNVHPQKKAQ